VSGLIRESRAPSFIYFIYFLLNRRWAGATHATSVRSPTEPSKMTQAHSPLGRIEREVQLAAISPIRLTSLVSPPLPPLP